MKKVLLLISFVFLINNLNLFAQNFEWAYRWNSVNGFTDTDVDVDNNGNIYIISYGGTTINFNMTTNNVNSVFGPTFGCAAVTKLDASGNLIWVKFITQTGATSGGCSPRRVKVKNGFIYVAGTFGGGGGSYDFDPNNGTAQSGGSNPNLKGFLLKWDLDGNYIWHKTQVSSQTLQIKDIDVDGNDNPTIVGSFMNSLYIGSFSLTSNGVGDGFVAKYDVSGNPIFVFSLGGSSTSLANFDSANSLSVDNSGSIYVLGEYEAAIDLDPGSGTSNFNSNGYLDVYVAKYSSTGTYLWGKSFGGSSGEQGNAVQLDGNQNIYVTGTSYGNVNFNPGGVASNLNGIGNYGYLTKYDSNGNFQFVKGFLPSNSQSTCIMKEMVVSSTELVLSGFISGSIDIDPSASSSIVNSGSINTVLTRLSTSGTFIWGGVLLNQDPYTNEPLGMAISNGAFYTAGSFKGIVDFNPDPISNYNLTSLTGSAGMPQGSNYILKMSSCSASFNNQSATSCGPFVWNGQTYQTSGTYNQIFQSLAGCDSTVTLNLTINSSTSSSFSETSCEPYTWNGNTYASSGQYSQTLSCSNGCDSIVTLNLTILNGPTAQVTQDGLLLTANTVSGASYQWIYCSDLTPVPNQTFSQFAPQANGTYAVVITDNCGSDTSDCITISTIGIDELKSVFQVYPNPVNSELNIEIDLTVSEAIYSILDLNYRIIQTGKILQSQPINVRSLADGTYILKIEGLGYVRFIKQ